MARTLHSRLQVAPCTPSTSTPIASLHVMSVPNVVAVVVDFVNESHVGCGNCEWEKSRASRIIDSAWLGKN